MASGSRSSAVGLFSVAWLVLACLLAPVQTQLAPIRVAIVGLVHGHVAGFLPALNTSMEAQLVAVVEPDMVLAQQYADNYQLDSNLFYTDLDLMLQQQHPDVVLVYTTIFDHRRVIEAAAKYGISSMVEKPLSTTLEDALAIRQAARDNGVHVLVNYETTWYASNAAAIQAAQNGQLGTIRKVLIYDGHQGPKEIGVGPEWLPWLTNPILNGAGALFDFGCYGADLMTVMQRGQPPLSVTAVTQTDKPDIYPKVDDDATIILRYNGTQAVLMPSWNWSFSRKDMEIYGTNGTVATVGSSNITVRNLVGEDTAPKNEVAPALPTQQNSSLSYLAAVLRAEVRDEGDLSALDTNLVVMQILSAARESAQTGQTIQIQSLPRELEACRGPGL